MAHTWRMRLRFALFAALALTACTPGQRMVLSSDDQPSAPAPVGLLPGTKYLHPDQADTQPCTAATSIDQRSMPCGLVLNLCSDDRRTTVLHPHIWSCAPGMLTTAEACVVQPEYAYFYGCDD